MPGKVFVNIVKRITTERKYSFILQHLCAFPYIFPYIVKNIYIYRENIYIYRENIYIYREKNTKQTKTNNRPLMNVHWREKVPCNNIQK